MASQNGYLQLTHPQCKPCAEQVEKFACMLKPHQRATTSDGSTVLEKAVVEHNLAACAALYCNISTRQLGSVLGTTPDKAEAIAARMVKEGRLKVLARCPGSDQPSQTAWRLDCTDISAPFRGTHVRPASIGTWQLGGLVGRNPQEG